MSITADIHYETPYAHRMRDLGLRLTPSAAGIAFCQALVDGGWSVTDTLKAKTAITVFTISFRSDPDNPSPQDGFPFLGTFEGKVYKQWDPYATAPAEIDPTSLTVIGVVIGFTVNQSVQNFADAITANSTFDAVPDPTTLDIAGNYTQIIAEAKVGGWGSNDVNFDGVGDVTAAPPPRGGGEVYSNNATDPSWAMQMQVYEGTFANITLRPKLNGVLYNPYPLYKLGQYRVTVSQHQILLYALAGQTLDPSDLASLLGGGMQYWLCSPYQYAEATRTYIAFAFPDFQLQGFSGSTKVLFDIDGSITLANGLAPTLIGVAAINHYVLNIGTAGYPLQTKSGKPITMSPRIGLNNNPSGETRMVGDAWNCCLWMDAIALDKAIYLDGRRFRCVLTENTPVKMSLIVSAPE